MGIEHTIKDRVWPLYSLFCYCGQELDKHVSFFIFVSFLYLFTFFLPVQFSLWFTLLLWFALVYTVFFTIFRGWKRTGKRCIRSFSPSLSSLTPYQRRFASRSWRKRWSSWSTTLVSSKSTKSFILLIRTSGF